MIVSDICRKDVAGYSSILHALRNTAKVNRDPSHPQDVAVFGRGVSWRPVVGSM